MKNWFSKLSPSRKQDFAVSMIAFGLIFMLLSHQSWCNYIYSPYLESDEGSNFINITCLTLYCLADPY